MPPHAEPHLANGDSSSIYSSASFQETASSESQVNENRRHGKGSIAIVGMACKLPGGVDSPSKLWDLLIDERSGQCDVPRSRFNIEGFYNPDPNYTGSLNMKGGYFLQDEDVRNFENEFFGINNMEAQYMDPQQRKLLETIYESFESAGLRMEDLSGANIGCYVGNFTMDFQQIQLRDPEYLHRYSATGLGSTILSNRINHVFDLRGPSLVVDTACSSSLYCLHLACMALENGECDGAIVAGANFIQSPEQQYATMKAGVLSPTSTCHTFDASADGYGRADGVGALYIKRLDDALRDGDAIRSIIRGTAINANGRTPGITQPSAIGQEAVIRKAHEKAGVSVRETCYVECHGTGTPVGDPIEVEAVSKALDAVHRQQPVLIGSVKSSIGHSEAASGISSVIKATLMLEKGLIPSTIGVQNLNPKIRSKERNVQVVSQAQPFPVSTTGGCRRVGINSFGYGGANAHVVLENAPSYPDHIRHVPRYAQTLSKPGHVRSKFLLPFSAFTAGSLEARFKNMASWPDIANVSIPDLAFNLGLRRHHFSERGFLIAGSDDLAGKLHAADFQLRLDPSHKPPSAYAFVFTGQGAQWAQMGMELLDEFHIFAAAVAEMDSVLARLPHPPAFKIAAALRAPPETSQVADVVYSQPLCVAVQIGLVMLLRSWGISPQAVVGHSSGEIAAAFAAGYLSLGDAITMAYYRGYVVSGTKRNGAMLVAGLSEQSGREDIVAAGLQGKIDIACINSQESVTFSGEQDAIEALLQRLQGQQCFARLLRTNGRAYHSHHMCEIGQEYERLAVCAAKTPRLSDTGTRATMFSSVTGSAYDGPYNASYWRKNLESPVRFFEAFSELAKTGSGYTVIEIGPHSALELPIKQIKAHLHAANNSLEYFPTLIRGKSSTDMMLSLAGRLWLGGHDIAWDKVNNPGLGDAWKPSVIPNLPPYPWAYNDVLWSECRLSYEFRNRSIGRHELIGCKTPGASDTDINWRNVLRWDDLPWLADHKLGDTIVLPGGAILAMAVEAVSQATETSLTPGTGIEMRNVHIVKALTIPTTSTPDTEIFTNLRPYALSKVSLSKAWWDFTISSHREGVAAIHSTGTICVNKDIEIKSIESVSQIDESSLELSAKRNWYQRFENVGLNYGPLFQSLDDIQISQSRSKKVVIARVDPNSALAKDASYTPKYPIHPITLDAMVQAGIIATAAGQTQQIRPFVPTKLPRAAFRVPENYEKQEACTWQIKATSRTSGISSSTFDAELFDSAQRSLALMEQSRLQTYPSLTSDVADELARQPMLRVVWKPDIKGPRLLEERYLSPLLEDFYHEARSSVKDEGLLKLGAVISFLTHRDPCMSILELGTDSHDSHEVGKAILEMLHSSHEYKRLRSYSSASCNDAGISLRQWDLASSQPGAIQKLSGDTSFDLIVVLNPGTTSQLFEGSQFDQVRALLDSGGVLLALGHSTLDIASLSNTWDIRTPALQDASKSLFIFSEKQLKPKLSNGVKREEPVIVIEREETVLGSALSKLIEDSGIPVQRLNFSNINDYKLLAKSKIVSLLEVEAPLLVGLTKDEMDRLKLLTDNAATLLWVTGGGLIDGKLPDMGLAAGLSRALILEQPSLRMVTYDVDVPSMCPDRTAKNLLQVLSCSQSAQSDSEFAEKNGLIHIARFVPDTNLNHHFRRAVGANTVETTLGDANGTLELAISHPGQFDSLYFREVETVTQLKEDEVAVSVKAVGVNAKDVYVLTGRVDTPGVTCALEFAGIVEEIGAGVTGLQKGDRVVAMAPNHFRSREVVPQWAVKRLLDSEDFTSVVTFPLVTATALYALRQRAAIQKGESVLIHSGAGGVGIAAIQLALQLGAEVYTTVSTKEKREFLVSTLGVKPERIFDSRDVGFANDVLNATQGRGVDVVLNSLTGDFLRESWRCIAPFGRFIEIGKLDITGSGRLEMDQFSRNATFSAFDLSEIYLEAKKITGFQKLWSQLLSDSMSLLRVGSLKHFAALRANRVFDISELSQAFRFFSSRSRLGKVVISLENPLSSIQVQHFIYRTRLDSNKSYIMIGCLGGLGRSLSRWMVERGARKLIFLSRSGMDKPTARRFVQYLVGSGVNCQVIKGDVTNSNSVQQVVDAVDGKIGGVVQASMGLDESLFSTMSNESWHTGIDPKVSGTWNLHNSIQHNGKDSELQFFLMLSSVSGSVGTATESNYCAGNHFLDMFARYRRAQGRPALAIGFGMISEIGYLHENPDIEALLLRRGIQTINEDEFLQITDLALSGSMEIPHVYDTAAGAHVLTGLEPAGFIKLREKGFNVTNLVFNDPRALVLSNALGSNTDVPEKSEEGSLPFGISKAMAQNTLTLREAVLQHIISQFASLILSQASRLSPDTPLAKFGMDSMIAAELRTWLFQVFKVDIPFQELLSKTGTLSSITSIVMIRIESGKANRKV